MQTTGNSLDSVEATLDEVSRLHGIRMSADARLFELVTVFANRHSGDALPRSRTVLPGMERAVQVGGAGTPHVAEFAMAELGARMQVSAWSARRMVADALDVRHRLPLIWARVAAGEARVGNARLVATRTRHLSIEAAARVDSAMVGHVDGSLAWGRFESRLTGKVVAADPEVAAAREAATAEEQFARRSRSSEHGIAGFYVRSTAGVIARLDATVTFLADALAAFGDTEPLELRRVKAIVLLANPVRAVELLAAFAARRAGTVDVELGFDQLEQRGTPEDEAEGDALTRMFAFANRVGFTPTRLPDWLMVPADPPDREPAPRFSFDWSALLPPLTMYLHLDASTLASGAGGVARWEGEGPVTHAFVHEHLRPLHRYVVKPVIDLAVQAPVDAYEIPDRLREAVHLMAPSDVFPFACAPSRSLEVDHTLAYGAGGTTRLGNLGPLSRLHHRIKTHGRWTVRQPFEGVYVWRDPHGRIYVVDHGGTHAVPRVAQRASGSSSGARGTAVRRANSAAVAMPVTSNAANSASGP
ncbi:MAG: HNH endonuclease signature motif containing protein [Nocardioidaceae bacterium]